MAEINFDIVEKLIRLANNNPNDNEANLAARKACKILAGYTFVRNTTAQPKPPPSRPSDPVWEDIFKYARERARQNSKQSYEKGDWNSPWDEQAKRDAEKEQRHREAYSGKKVEPTKCSNCGNMFYGILNEKKCPRCTYENFTYDARNVHYKWERSKPKEEKKSRQCSKCGHWKETSRVTNVFVCNECQWNEFKEKQNEPESY